MTTRAASTFIGDTLRAHALLFEHPLRPVHGNDAGLRVIVAFVLVAVGVFYGLRFALDGSALPARLAFVALLLVSFAVAQRVLVRLPFADIGMRAWREWTRREKLYLLQVAPIAAVAFTIVFQQHLRALHEHDGTSGFAVAVATGFLWGLVQEFLYRGWLQLELTRRFGAVAGLVVANVVFTFGPLHANQLFAAAGPAWGMLGAIFLIGLVFGLIFQRSGNLWIPAVLHGLWPLNMT